MKPAFVLLLFFGILTSRATKAQCLSFKELLVFADEGFDMPETKLRNKGFAPVRWRRDDPDIDGNAGAHKEYSRTRDAFLIFHPDAHGRILEEVIYRFRSPACVASLRKQIAAAGFAEVAVDTSVSDDENSALPLFSPYDGLFSNARYLVRIVGAMDAQGKDLHHYSVSVRCTGAMQEMQDAIDEVNRQVQQTDAAVRNKKPR